MRQEHAMSALVLPCSFHATQPLSPKARARKVDTARGREKRRQKGAETERSKGGGRQKQREVEAERSRAGTSRGRDVVLRSPRQAGKRDGVGTQHDVGQDV